MGSAARSLREHGIETLAGIRAVGAPAKIEGLTEPQWSAARTLEAHARLEVVSPDPAVNAKLASAGISAICNFTRGRRLQFGLGDRVVTGAPAPPVALWRKVDAG